MRFLFQILIMVFCAENISAQNTYFKKRLECLPNEVDLNNGVLPIENGYLLFGSLTYQGPEDDFDVSILKIDEYGNPLDTVVFGYDSAITEIKSLFKMPVGYLGVGHRKWDSEINRFNPYLVRFDENLDTLWTKIIIFGQDTLPFVSQVILCHDSTIAIGGVVNRDSVYDDGDVMFLRIDTIGNVITYKKFGYANVMDGGGAICQTLDKGFAIGSATNYNHPLGSGYYYTVLYKLDSLGNQQWFRKWGRNDAQNGSCGVMNLKDSSILVNSRRATQADVWPIQNRASNLQKITYNNTLVWDNDYGPIQNNNYTYLNGITSYFQKGDSTIFAIRTEGSGWPIFTLLENNGDLIWERTHRIIYGDHIWGNASFVQSDDGFVMSGFLQPCFGCGDTGTQDIFVIKTNCLGFAYPPLVNATTGSLDNFEVVLENNSMYFGNVYIDWGDGNSDTLYESSDTLIYHTYPSSGNYSATIIAEACGDSDTLNLNMVSSLVGVSEHEKPKFRIYPNPANEFFYIQTDNSISEYEVILMDISGKIILRNENAKQIDVSEFSNGFYLIHIPELNHTEKIQILR
jgi:hypothetical protein